MKIVIATFGTTGDVQPFLALGVELLRRGHEVVLAAPPNFAPRAARHGLGFRGLGSSADDAETLHTIALASQQAGMDEQIRLTLAVPMKYAEASVHELVETARDADALVSIPYLAAGQISAELLGLPFVSVHFSPFGSSRRPRLSAVAAPSFNALRKGFGLDPVAEPLGVDGISPTLALTPVSPSIFPRPASWPVHHHVTGFWFLDEPAEPDPALQAFLAAGEPPVVIGFGSMAHEDPAAVTRILLRAVDAAQVRAVIQSGWSGLSDEHPPKNVIFTSFVPHAWLFPQASCVVHGGGAGTTAAGMRAGIPSVFVPHWLDQFMWGALARERRLASASIPIRELEPDALAAAMLAARDSAAIRACCEEASRAIRAEDGVAVAAGLIEALGGRRGGSRNQPVRLSAVVLEDTVGDSIAPGKPDASPEGFPGMWERCSCARKPRFTSPAEEKNRVWPATRGEWVLFVEGGRKFPPLARFLAPIDADVVCPEAPRSAVILRPPFAIRRTLLEALGGFQDLPCGLDDVDLGLRAQEAGASILHAKDWVGSSSELARPLDFEGVIALFTRHPFAWILKWGCEQSEAKARPGEPTAQRFARIFGRPVPYHGHHSLKELADHLAERAEPPLLPTHEIARQLERAEASGLYGTGPAGDRRFERSHAANWLMANTIYFESIAERNLCLLFPPPRLRGGPQAEPLAIAVEGRYEVEVDSASLVGLGSPSLGLPLPVEGPEQRDLELFAFEPSDFEAFIDETRTTARLPLRPEAGGPVRIGYSFRCTVHEGTTRGAGPATLGPAPTLSPAYQSKLDAVFASIFGGGAPDANPRARARRIYGWILDHIPCRRSDRLGLFALDARAGNCAHRVRLFSLLCHRCGLETRERFGIPAGDLHSHGILDGRQWAVAVCRERIHSPIHVWAEVFLEDAGWMPVDFFGTDSGQRMMTPQNVRNPSTRARLRAWTPRLDDYYFGSVDPYRVHFAQRPKSLGAIPSGVPDGNIEAIWKVAWGTRHEMRTRLSGLPPGNFEVN